MVIHNLDFPRFAGRSRPHEANTPLVIDAKAVLPGAVAGELLQPVAWRGSQVAQVAGAVQVQQLPPRRSLNVRGELAGHFPVKHLFGFGAGERLDHGPIVSLGDTAVKFSQRAVISTSTVYPGLPSQFVLIRAKRFVAEAVNVLALYSARRARANGPAISPRREQPHN